MKKMKKTIKEFIVILLVILISIIAFLGFFKKENGIWKNLIPNYKYGMDIEGARELKYSLDTSEEEKYVYVDENGNIMGEVWKDGSPATMEDEASSTEEGHADTTNEEVPYVKEKRTIKVNSDDKLTRENFEEAKKIVQQRLKAQNVLEYNIRIDDVTGNLMVETTNDNDNVKSVENLIEKNGKFQIIDYQNGVVLMDNSDIKKASVVSSNESSYNTYLQIEFNKEGSEKLREISTKYVEIENDTENEETTEEIETDEDEHNHTEETEKKYVSVVFDDTTMMTTYFGEEMTAGILQISVGQARTDYDEFIEDYNSAKAISDILNSGVLPITYQLETDNFVKSELTTQNRNIIQISCVILVVIVSFLFIVKYKKSGFIAAILSFGYIASLSIAVRYTNVIITKNSMVAGLIIIVINYIFMNMILKRLKTQKMGQVYTEVAKKFYLSSIPVMVATILFTFSKYTFINSIGMLLFWGIILNIVYNFIFTRTILEK